MPASTLTPDRARRLLHKFRRGRSSQTSFCMQHGVSPSLFSYWQRRIQHPIPVGKTVFQEVPLPPSSALSACILTLPNGTRLEFPASHLGTALDILTGGKASC